MYNNINRNLLFRYKKYLKNKQTDLQVKAVGIYWTKDTWTNKDQENWNNITRRLNILNNKYYIY